MTDLTIELFYKAEDFFFRNLSKEIITIDDKTLAYITEVNSSGLNPVIQRDFIISPESLLNKAVEIYNNYNLPWIWVVQEKFTTTELKNAFEARGLEEIDQSTAMIYNLAEASYFVMNELQIIEDVNNLSKWGKPLCKAFESTKKSTLQYIKAHQRFKSDKGKLFHFVGFINSHATTSLTLSIVENYARIDDVGTLPMYQNKGFATSMIKYALNKAKTLGADYCFLEASQAGRSLYKKIGFNELFNNKIFGTAV